MPTAPLDRRDFLRHGHARHALPMAGLALQARAEPAALVARRVFSTIPIAPMCG
jgi:hypothetical protein